MGKAKSKKWSGPRMTGAPTPGFNKGLREVDEDYRRRLEAREARRREIEDQT